MDLKPLMHHLQTFSLTSKLLHQSLKFMKSHNFSLLGEAQGRYNNRDQVEKQVGRFNVSLMSITKDSSLEV